MQRPHLNHFFSIYSTILSSPTKCSHNSFEERGRRAEGFFSFILSGLRRYSSSLLTAVVFGIPLGIPALATLFLSTTASAMTLETYNNWNFYLVEKEFIFAQSRRDTEGSEILTFALKKGKCYQSQQFFEVFTMTNHPQLDLLLDEELGLRENGSPTEGKVIHIQPHLGGKIVLVDMGVYKNDDILKYYSHYNRFRVTVTKHPLKESINLSNLFDVTTQEWKLNDLDSVIKRAEQHCERIPKPIVAHFHKSQKGLKI